MKKSNSFKIAAYIRVSTQEQALNPEGSIKNQKERIIQTVKLKNMEDNFGEIVDFFIDSGLSGKDTKRPELQRLLKQIEEKKINLVISTELSRISRNMHDFAGIWELFKRQDCSFLSLRENFDTTTAAGEMVLYTIANIAQFERRQVSERVSFNMNARAERGLFNGGRTPFGYQLTEAPQKIIPHSIYAQTVKIAFEKFLELERLPDTCKWLNTNGYEYPGQHNHFTPDRLRRILSNKTYVALRDYRFQGEIKTIQAVWEPIISSENFEQAGKILERGYFQRKKEKPTRYPYLLTGLCFCKRCGDVMSGKSAWGRNKKIGYYEHGWATRKDSVFTDKLFRCSPHRVPANKLEPLVLEELLKLLTEDELLKNLLDEARSMHQSNTKDRELQRFRDLDSSYGKQIEAIVKRLSELPVNVTAAPFYKQMASIENKKGEVANNIQKLLKTVNLEEPPVKFETLKQFADTWRNILLSEGNNELKAVVISKFIKRIDIGEDSITVHYFVSETKLREVTKENEF